MFGTASTSVYVVRERKELNEISTITGKPKPTFQERISLLEAGVEYLRNNLFGDQEPRDYPEDFRDFISESSFAERSKVVDSPTPPMMVGEIQGLSKGAAKAVRKIMQAETKARGAAPLRIRDKVKITTDYDTLQQSELVSDPISSALRGTLYHGRTTLPEGTLVRKNPLTSEIERIYSGEGKLGSRITAVEQDYSNITNKKFNYIDEVGLEPRRPDLRGAREKERNIGEPTGISLSYNPVVAHKFSGRPKNELARVMPLYGGPPEDVIVNAWTPAGGKVMQETYLEAGKQLIGNIQARADTAAKQMQAQISKIDSNERFKDFLSSRAGLETEFNQLQTEFIQKRGYKGILYSPHRFDEYELKMFDPGDVLVVDRRKILKKGGGEEFFGVPSGEVNAPFTRMGFEIDRRFTGKITGETKTMKAMEDLTNPVTQHSLRDWYNELDVAKELGLRKAPTEFERLSAEFIKKHGSASNVDASEVKKYKKMLEEAEDISDELVDEDYLKLEKELDAKGFLEMLEKSFLK